MQPSAGDAVCVITLNRPERLNSFTAEDYRELRAAFETFLQDDDAHVAVLTSSGRAFSAGADRSLLSSPPDDPRTEQAGLEFSRLLDILGALDKPLLAAVNGAAVGFGATMLMYCDLVLVAQSARLRYPFTALGVVPEAGSSALVSMKARWPDAMGCGVLM